MLHNHPQFDTFPRRVGELFSQQFSKRIANENVIRKLPHVRGLQNGQFVDRAVKAAKDEIVHKK